MKRLTVEELTNLRRIGREFAKAVRLSKTGRVSWSKGIKYVLPETKLCPRCGEILPAEKFNRNRSGRQLGQLLSYCRMCSSKQAANRRSRNPEKHRNDIREWHKDNRGYINEYRRNKYDSDPQWKIARALRRRFGAFLRRGVPKGGPTLNLFGASLLEVQNHLEALFRPGMTWENYGPVWEIDHVRPCASFDLTDVEQQKLCFHFSNTQPLFVLENRRKGDRV